MNFRVEIEGIAASDFLTVCGIEAAVNVVDYRNGGDKLSSPRKLPGEASFTNLILRRGLTADLSLWDWMRQTLEGQVSRRNVSIVLLDDAREAVLRFNVVNAWPVKWTGPALNAESSDVAIETLEITHEGLAVGV
jgi:phage tail-like protein